MQGSSTSPAELVGHLERTQLVNYVAVACLTLLVHDYCLTLVDEVYLIWNSKLNLMKILYFLSRYPAFVDAALTVYLDIGLHVPIDYCLPANAIISWLTAIGIGVAELILILRTFALWIRNKKVLNGLLALFMVLFIAALAITGIFLRTVIVTPPPYPSFPGCNIIGGTPIIFFNFVMVILFETVIVGMTVFRVYRDFRGTRNPLIGTLYRDGVIFYVFLFAISLSNVFNLSFGPSEFQNLLTLFQRVMHSLLSCRIIIHARRADRMLQKSPVARQILQIPLHAFAATESSELDVDVILCDKRGIDAWSV